MKWHNFLLLFILILESGCTSDNINDLNKRNNRWAWWVDASSKKGRWIPLNNHPTWKNGSFTKFYFDGKVAAKGKVKNGKYTDTTFWFDSGGGIYAYKIETMDSANDFYTKEGPIRVYDTDGKIKMEGIIQNHKPGDKWTEYYKTGYPKRIVNVFNDTGWITDYYNNGKLKDSLFAFGAYGLTHGEWNQEGVRTFLAGIKGGNYDGLVLRYYDDGTPKQKVFYSNGKVNGKGFYYWPDGKIKKEYNFKDSLKEGNNFEYFENGNIQNAMIFKNGKLHGEQKTYDEKGNLIADSYFNDGIQIK